MCLLCVCILFACQAAVELVSRTEDLTKRVDQHSQTIAQIEEKLEEASEQLEAKIGSDGKGDAGGGAIQLKEALRAMREECGMMNLQIGLISANITEKRVTQAGRLLSQQRSKRNKKIASRSDSRHLTNGDDLEASIE